MKTKTIFDHYDEFKAASPDAIILFRVGDFYESFRDDAVTLSRTLGLALTAMRKPSADASGQQSEIPMVGFPYHQLEAYLAKLVYAGHRVAICEQTA